MHEQDPQEWWTATVRAVEIALDGCSSAERSALRALCVDGTSGTVLGLDRRGTPVTPALMYDDVRAAAAARELDAIARRSSGQPAGISSSWGVAKLLWLQRERAGEFEATDCFAHQADFIAGQLTGRFGVTDQGNALKSGFDVERGQWAGWLDAIPELRRRLPDVLESGVYLATLRNDVAARLSLPREVVVVAGTTDGTAAFLASGASRPGDDNTTLGTTLVFKRVATRHVRDTEGLLYCHRLPGGAWLPGAASNVGAGWIREEYGDREPCELDAEAVSHLPSPSLAYQPAVPHERFPFRADRVAGFIRPNPEGAAARYAARLQGVALTERLAYDVLDRSAPSSGRIFATGGGSASDVWTQLRADVTGRTYHRPRHPESAYGSALLALAHTTGRDLWDVLGESGALEATFRPRAESHAEYSEYYRRFTALLERLGYLGQADSDD
jgi:sugar (pentulose or hexulose) kinase